MTERELLFSVTKNDFIVQTFRAGGKGGQNQNKRDTGVRIIHKATGLAGEARDQRTQGQNKKNAFLRLVHSDKFQLWLKIQCGKAALSVDEINRQIDTDVAEMMAEENLRVEVWNGKEWVKEDA